MQLEPGVEGSAEFAVEGRLRTDVRRVAAVLLLLAALIVPAAGASRAEPMPLAVRSASLTQAGQDLVWRVALAAPFSAAGLQRDRRALCLLIERASGTVAGQLCVA